MELASNYHYFSYKSLSLEHIPASCPQELRMAQPALSAKPIAFRLEEDLGLGTFILNPQMQRRHIRLNSFGKNSVI